MDSTYSPFLIYIQSKFLYKFCQDSLNKTLGHSHPYESMCHVVASTLPGLFTNHRFHEYKVNASIMSNKIIDLQSLVHKLQIDLKDCKSEDNNSNTDGMQIQSSLQTNQISDDSTIRELNNNAVNSNNPSINENNWSNSVTNSCVV